MTKTTHKTARKQAQILGVGINSTSREGVLRAIASRLSNFNKKTLQKTPFGVVSVNPEGVIRAQKDEKFKSIVNSSDISFADGVGLIQASEFLAMPAPKNKPLRAIVLLFQGAYVGLRSILGKHENKDFKLVKGRKLFLDLITLANKKGWRVFFYGGERGEAQGSAELLEKSYKRIKIGAMDGPSLNESGTPTSKKSEDFNKRSLKQINEFNPHLLFLAFSPPKQEKWFFLNKRGLKVGGVVMVGGTFNYVSGKSKLPPNWMERAGLEWIWRLVTEPKRIKRILTAFPIFPLLIFWNKFKAK